MSDTPDMVAICDRIQNFIAGAESCRRTERATAARDVLRMLRSASAVFGDGSRHTTPAPVTDTPARAGNESPVCDHHWIGGNDGSWCTKCLEERPSENMAMAPDRTASDEREASICYGHDLSLSRGEAECDVCFLIGRMREARAQVAAALHERDEARAEVAELLPMADAAAFVASTIEFQARAAARAEIVAMLRDPPEEMLRGMQSGGWYADPTTGDYWFANKGQLRGVADYLEKRNG